MTVTTASTETATGHTEEEAYAKLVDQINKLKKEAEARGEHLYWNETDLSETEIMWSKKKSSPLSISEA